MLHSFRLVRSLVAPGLVAGLLLGGVSVASAHDGIASTSTPKRAADSAAAGLDQFTELAAALVAGPAAVQKLHDFRISPERFRLKLKIPRVGECVATQDESDVACYAELPTEYVAHGVFDTLLVQLRGSLPASEWEEIDRQPRGIWTRRMRFRHVESGARIDLDISRMEGGEFRVWVFGFPKSG
jgi:hypothetical protein